MQLETMKAIRTVSGWIVQPENNKEEIALMHFLQAHERVSFSTTSTEYSERVGKREPIAPQLRPVDRESEPPLRGRKWPQVPPPRPSGHDFLSDL